MKVGVRRVGWKREVKIFHGHIAVKASLRSPTFHCTTWWLKQFGLFVSARAARVKWVWKLSAPLSCFTPLARYFRHGLCTHKRSNVVFGWREVPQGKHSPTHRLTHIPMFQRGASTSKTNEITDFFECFSLGTWPSGGGGDGIEKESGKWCLELCLQKNDFNRTIWGRTRSKRAGCKKIPWVAGMERQMMMERLQ